MTLRHILALTALIWLYSCSEKPDNATYTDTLPPIFPDYAGVTIPAGIAPLNFAVTDTTAEVQSVYVTVKGSKAGILTVGGDFADFPTDKWHQLTAENTGGKLIFTVNAKIDGKWLRYRGFDVNDSC